MSNSISNQEENSSEIIKSDYFNRRNFLRISSASIAALTVTTVVEAKNGAEKNTPTLSNATTNLNDHSLLEGLSDDDHQQYLNVNRGDIRYYQKPEIDSKLSEKESVIETGKERDYFRGDKTFQRLDKTAVGLNNVDNTTDREKPISDATQAALDTRTKMSDKDQPNGYCGLDSEGKMNKEQIGNFTSPQNGQNLTFRDGVIINVSETYRRLDTEFGIIADGVTNNAPAIQTALTSLRDNYGGTLVFPPGVTKIAGDSTINMLGNQGAIKMLGAGNSVIQITPGTTTAFTFQNNSNLTVEGLTFIGVHGAGAYDFTKSVFSTEWVEQVTFRDCQFLGLSVNAPYGEPYNGYAENKYHGIVVAHEGDLLIDRCIFGGNGTNQCPNVGVTTWNALTIRDSQFVDYGYYRGDTLTKTGYTTNSWWVRAINPKPNLVSARIKNKVTIERTTFDESHAYSGIMVYGGQWVDINNLVVNSGLGAAVSLINVKHSRIRDCYVGNPGLTTTNEYAVALHSCERTEIENLTTAGTVKYVHLGGATPKAMFNHCQLQGGSLAANGIINQAGAEVTVID